MHRTSELRVWCLRRLDLLCLVEGRSCRSVPRLSGARRCGFLPVLSFRPVSRPSPVFGPVSRGSPLPRQPSRTRSPRLPSEGTVVVPRGTSFPDLKRRSSWSHAQSLDRVSCSVAQVYRGHFSLLRPRSWVVKYERDTVGETRWGSQEPQFQLKVSSQDLHPSVSPTPLGSLTYPRTFRRREAHPGTWVHLWFASLLGPATRGTGVVYRGSRTLPFPNRPSSRPLPPSGGTDNRQRRETGASEDVSTHLTEYDVSISVSVSPTKDTGTGVPGGGSLPVCP